MTWSLLLLALWALASASAGPPPVRIRVQPQIAQSPSDVHLTVFVERHADNRRLDVIVDSPNFSQRSSRQLDGDAAPRVFNLWSIRLPCGRYIAVARVIRLTTTLQATATFHLVGPECPDSDEP